MKIFFVTYFACIALLVSFSVGEARGAREAELKANRRFLEMLTELERKIKTHTTTP